MDTRSAPSGGRTGHGPSGLGEFLRARRARITPEQAGLAVETGTRRVPGLRREELARLAGISVDYYIQLERGRTSNASESVLGALARALGLDDTERAHLLTLAQPARARRHTYPSQRVRSGMLRVLGALNDVPAIIFGRRLDVLAANPLAKAVYTDFDALPHRERNMARYVFLDDAVRDLYADWDTAARGITAALQLYAGRHPDDPRLAELVGDLSVRDPDFRRWWADHDVYRYTSGVKHYHHPLVGDLTLDYESFTPDGDSDQSLGLYTAEPGSPSAQALRILASWTAGQAAEPAPGQLEPRSRS
jgi:transcriptional regulator with XRE-family HTH domain